MFVVKIYDNQFDELTEFLEGEYQNLTYDNRLGEVGSCSFLLQTKNTKVTEENIRHYNRVEVIENGFVEFVGYIVTKRVTLDIVEVRCLQLFNILKKRLYSGTLTGNAGDAMITVLAAANATEDTGITAGDIVLSSTIDLTFDNLDVFSVLKSIAEKSSAQMLVDNDRNFNAKTTLGDDLSASVNVLYNINQPEQATLLKFEVSDDGTNIVTRAKAVSGSFTATKNDSALQSQYGILEAFSNIAVANDQDSTDDITEAQLKDANYSPRLDLNPLKANLEFNAGDKVHIDISSGLVNISGDYQVLQKSVKIQGKQKLVSITTNTLKSDIITEIRTLQKKLALIETQI